MLLFPTWILAQNSKISGNLIDNESGQAIQNASIQIVNSNLTVSSNEKGFFELSNIPNGEQVILISHADYVTFSRSILVSKEQHFLGTVALLLKEIGQVQEEVPLSTISESDIRESAAIVSGALSASRDAFTSAVNFTFSGARFRARGYDGREQVNYLNGMQLTDMVSGRSMFYVYSGLNDVMRAREGSYGLDPVTYGIGGIGGSSNIDSRAVRQRKQLQASYAVSNRTYENRLMLTYGSGMNSKGWAFALSGSKRWADEGYAPGSYYDGYSMFAAVDKQIGLQHTISFIALASPSEFGKSSPSVQEMYDLSGTNYYNPNWGYQQGEKRNAVVNKSFLPAFFLNYEYRVEDNATLFASVSMLNGTSKVSALDWYNAPDPRPDYYRNLPSFQTDPIIASMVYQQLKNNEAQRQINWDQLYLVNYNSYASIQNANGIAGNTVSGLRARYIVEDRVTEYQTTQGNLVYNKTLKNIQYSAGLSMQMQNNSYYKEVNDLLGADFYVDLNQYAEQDFPDDPDALQNDLNNPNRILKEGDRFGYDYDAVLRNGAAFFQLQSQWEKFDWFAAVQLNQTSYYRNGNVKNGIFKDDSFGKSKTYSFTGYMVKTGLTYKINGRNYLFTNLANASHAPLFEDVFISARTRNQSIENPEQSKVFSVEGGYLLKAPSLKLRAVGYFTAFRDEVSTLSFYHEDFRSFVNYTLKGIDRNHSGMELAAEKKLYGGFTLSAVAAIGQYYYQSRPSATVTQDNNSEVLSNNETIYFKNLRIAAGPQQAYTFGVNYRSKKFWFVNVNFNYFDAIYINTNPARRTQAAVDLIPYSSAEWNRILSQEKVDGQFTVDVFGSWSWRLNNKFKALKRNTFVVFNLGINNLLNNQDFITNGYEQLRFDFSDRNPDKFDTKYFYAYGINYFFNITLRMN